MIPTQCAGVSLVAFLSVYLCRTYAIASSISKSPVPGEVFQLTDLNFDQVINGTHPWFIDIYAPWYVSFIHLYIVDAHCFDSLRAPHLLFSKTL